MKSKDWSYFQTSMYPCLVLHPYPI